MTLSVTVWLSPSLVSLPALAPGLLSATVPDLLRLAVVPVFAWAAVRDVKTRRISGDVWMPLAALGAVLLAWDGWVARAAGPVAWQEFLLPAAVSVGFVVPLAYLFWWFGGFGGADAKALLVLAIAFPTFPAYAVGEWTLPLTTTPIRAFSFTILTNAVLVGVVAPLALAVRNAIAGRFAPVMFVGWPVDREAIPRRHGKLLETRSGLTRSGLDLDALRMYLRWRGLSLTALVADPERYRNPASLPDEPNPPTDGAVDVDAPVADGGTVDERSDDAVRDDSRGDVAEDDDAEGDETSGGEDEYDDPWGAEAFLEDLDGGAYGTSPADLRRGLEALVGTETVWISPGTPFLVPVFVGLVIALVYGDLLLGLVF